MSVVVGKLTYSFDADGNITALSLDGHVQLDVCATLSRRSRCCGALAARSIRVSITATSLDQHGTARPRLAG